MDVTSRKAPVRRSMTNAAQRARAALRRTVRDDAGPSCAPISSARSASGAGTEEREPDLDVLADRFAEHGYVDDAAYALAKSRSLTGRGYGKRRVVAGAARRRRRR